MIPALLGHLITGAASALAGKLLAPSSSSSTPKADFAALLDKARAGDLPSDLPVQLGKDVQAPLTPDQLQRIALAADKAESAGMASALVLIDGQALLLDVTSRTITGSVSPDASTLDNIDGIVAAPPGRLNDIFAQPAAQASSSTAQPSAQVSQNQLLAQLASTKYTSFPRSSRTLTLTNR